MYLPRLLKVSSAIATIGLCSGYSPKVCRLLSSTCTQLNSNVPPHTPDNIKDLRKEYSSTELTEDMIDSNPFEQFKNWFDDACTSKVIEPNAMVRYI